MKRRPEPDNHEGTKMERDSLAILIVI
jgi:hypothetical protein